ncbi:MAG: glycoside hydrolase family 65 protein [Candidatus Izemoplasmatales bacterium]
MKLVERNNRIDKKELFVDETIFSLSSGIIGVRGNFIEGYGFDQAKQTYMNGYYNTYDYKYEENSIHFPQEGERIVNIIDGQTIDIFLNGEPLHMGTAKLKSLHRSFDLDLGYSLRQAHYLTQHNKEIILTEKKMVSFVDKELLLIDVQVESVNFEGKIEFRSALELPKQRLENKLDPRINIAKNPEVLIEKKVLKPDYAALNASTSRTSLKLKVAMTHSIDFLYEQSSSGVEGVYTEHLTDGGIIHFTKYVVYKATSLHKEIDKSTLHLLDLAKSRTWSYYIESQKESLSKFWSHSLVEIDEDPDSTLMLQYNLYQLNASHSGLKELNIASKGLSGEGYEGHYFWDTEIYMFPFFLLTNHEKALSLIKNRYLHLGQAKNEALKLGVSNGAKIPWRTINGNELSPYYPAGSAQFHINSDVAYTVIKYFSYTLDLKFLKEVGFELLVETGRFLLEAGNFTKNAFHINAVTGPDEYSALVNDNYYTNSMAQYHFKHIVSYYQTYAKQLEKVIQKLGLTKQEIDLFKKAEKQMTFLFDESKNVFAQDESFLHKPELSIDSIPKANFPLLLHYHPLFIYRHQVLKQADTLLSMFLLDYQDKTIMKSNFDYYLKRTTHDSSLSKCIYSINAAKLNDPEIAFDYLKDVLETDFLDTHHNTHHGLHVANLGGSYLSMIYGLLGLTIHQGSLSISPILPKEMKGIRVQIVYQEKLIKFHVTHQLIEILTDQQIQIGIYNDVHSVTNELRCDYKG